MPSYEMRDGVWIVDPQEGLFVGQVPVPAGGAWSEVNIPPAKNPSSVDCAKEKPENSRAEKANTRNLFKTTSQQGDLTAVRNYSG